MQIKNAINVGTDYQKFQNAYFKIFAGQGNECMLLMFFVKKFNEYNFFNKIKPNGYFYLSLKRIREECFDNCLSMPTVIKLIDGLVDKNFVKKIVCKNSNQANFYTINFNYINSLVGKREEVRCEDYVDDEQGVGCINPCITIPRATHQVQLKSDTAKKQNEEIKESWNSIAKKHGLNKIEIVKPERVKKLKEVCKYVGLEQKEFFEKLDAAISKSGFLKGTNTRGWKCGFDFFLSKPKAVKTLEGGYDGEGILSFKELERKASQARLDEMFKDEE